MIQMFYDDHNPPHFHAEYSGMRVAIDIRTLGLIEGTLPSRALGLVTEWPALHQDELLASWGRAKGLQPPGRIDPLP